MCYSAEADMVAGLVIGAVGIDAIRHIDDRRYLPLAAVPLVLAGHQLIEAVAWWSMEGRASPASGELAVAAYLLIALGIVPLLVPYAVWRSEVDPARRARMLPFLAIGLVTSMALLYGMAAGTYGATIAGRYIEYAIAAPGGGLVGGTYVLATCVPFLLSSNRRLVLFGGINLVAVSVLALLLSAGLISLWCVWAAVTSVVIAREVRGTSAVPSRRIAIG